MVKSGNLISKCPFKHLLPLNDLHKTNFPDFVVLFTITEETKILTDTKLREIRWPSQVLIPSETLIHKYVITARNEAGAR